MFAIIGGTGFEQLDGFEVLEKLETETPFGLASSGLKRVRINQIECLFVSRHGEAHELSPSEVNYRANIFVLKKLGASVLISLSAVGSLKAELKPGDLVCYAQAIDRTKGIRKHSFCGEGFVGHVSLADPICKTAAKILKRLSEQYDFDCHFEKTLICNEGPYYSTRAEALQHIQAGADIVGMTQFPEFALAREAGLHYLPCCFVTDYDCWDESIRPVTIHEVASMMKVNQKRALCVLSDFVSLFPVSELDCKCPELGLRTGIMTAEDKIPKDKQAWLQALLA